MAIDLEAIKRKLAAMNGDRQANMSNVQQWKPEVGEYKVRVLPWKDADSSMPFHERSFYFFGKFGCLVPTENDPIGELRMKLFSDSKNGDLTAKAMAKQLFPKTYYYAKIIVRGQEDKGPMIWKFGKQACQRLFGFFVDEDVGDFIDLENGCDLKVKISKTPGKDFLDTTIDAGRPGPASKDKKQAQEWYEKDLNVDDLHRNRFKSISEIEGGLNAWLSAGSEPAADTTANETTRGGSKSSDDLDTLAKDMSTTKPAATKAEKKKTVVEDDEDETPAAKTDLDSAFDDLMNDD